MRAGGEHCHATLAVEVRRGTLPARTAAEDEAEDEDGEDEEAAADIKSNNPHLTGGEICKRMQIRSKKYICCKQNGYQTRWDS